MNTIIGLLVLFVAVAPLYIGIVTISSFCGKKNKPIVERTKECRNPRFLAICIVLLVLIPAEFVYSTLTHAIPDGDYNMNVEYRAREYSPKEKFEAGSYFTDQEFSGVAHIIVHIENDEYYEDDGETSWGMQKTKTTSSKSAWVTCVILDCFDEKYYVDCELSGSTWCEFDVDYQGKTYNVELSNVELTEKNLNYTIEDRIADISSWNVAETTILFVLNVIGIVGYFKAISIYRKEMLRKEPSGQITLDTK